MSNQTLEKLRNVMDDIDIRILDLLNQRMEIAIKISKIKKQLNCDFYDSKREDKILQRLCEKNYGVISNQRLENIYKQILLTSVEIMKDYI